MARIRKEENQIGVKPKWLFGKYERLSKEDMQKGESRSITSQDVTIENHINQLISKGENVDIVDTYIDDGTSGVYNNNRVNFQRMLADIEEEKINAVIVCDLSRMFRNDADQKYYLESYFRSKRIRVISCSLPQLDTYYDPNGIYKLDVKFQGLVNANQPIETSIKIKERLSNWRKQGAFVGSFAPYGYKKDPDNRHNLLRDEEASDVIRDIYNWFVYDGYSIRKIVEHLNSLGIVNPSEYKRLNGSNYKNPFSDNNSTLWSGSTVRNILKLEYYIGNMEQHRCETMFLADKKVIVPIDESEKEEIVTNTHEAIIDKRTFELAKNLLKQDRRTSPTTNQSYLFSGLLVCGDCHKAMVVKRAKEIVYYYCSTYLKRSKLACTKHTIREDILKETVLKVIQLQIALALEMKQEIDKINHSNKVNKLSSRIENLLNTNKNTLLKQETILDSAYYDWKNGDITKEQYQRIKNNTEEKVTQIKEAILELRNQQEMLKTNIHQNNQYLETFLKYQNITELDRKILVELIHKIYVYEDSRIETCFNFTDEYKLTLEFIKNNK
jgi:DNA invertase Pin-like site-specific DNA recombinase